MSDKHNKFDRFTAMLSRAQKGETEVAQVLLKNVAESLDNNEGLTDEIRIWLSDALRNIGDGIDANIALLVMKAKRSGRPRNSNITLLNQVVGCSATKNISITKAIEYVAEKKNMTEDAVKKAIYGNTLAGVKLKPNDLKKAVRNGLIEGYSQYVENNKARD